MASETSGDYALKALDCALADYREGRFDVLVTNPIDNTSEFQFSGQSRYIEDHLETDGHGQTLMVDGGLRIALATRNLPLRQVVECITQGSIEQTCRKLAQSLRRDFRLSNPRIALLSINPKAGDNGLLGTEEQEIIRPAIETLTTEGIQAFGPYAADALFAGNDYTHFDAIVAMYYEQGTIPFHALCRWSWRPLHRRPAAGPHLPRPGQHAPAGRKGRGRPAAAAPSHLHGHRHFPQPRRLRPGGCPSAPQTL